ncbi:MAG: acyl-CoA thioesterase [Thermodesulfobacteria bacterium]|nr:acyl-CoA thioesterase [Thermodesulfobacteriota bacterium]
MSNEKRPIWSDPIRYRVIYGDTDRAGVVYYANYLRLFEMGRTEWMRARLGTPYRELEGMGVLFPVVEAHVRYKAPAGYDDLLEISTGLSEWSPVTLTFCYEIKRDGKILVTGSTKHAAANTTGRLTRIPKELSDALSRLTMD